MREKFDAVGKTVMIKEGNNEFLDDESLFKRFTGRSRIVRQSVQQFAQKLKLKVEARSTVYRAREILKLWRGSMGCLASGYLCGGFQKLDLKKLCEQFKSTLLNIFRSYWNDFF